MIDYLEVNENVFESIKHIDEYGMEYWFARDLQEVFTYKEWRKFEHVISKAKESCINSNMNLKDHFVCVDKMVEIGSNTKRETIDYMLSRYACYLIAQNGDLEKR